MDGDAGSSSIPGFGLCAAMMSIPIAVWIVRRREI